MRASIKGGRDSNSIPDQVAVRYQSILVLVLVLKDTTTIAFAYADLSKPLQNSGHVSISMAAAEDAADLSESEIQKNLQL